MRNKRTVLFLILILSLGFAAVSATLSIEGFTLIGANEQDFKVYFSQAKLDDIDKSNVLIKEDKQVVDFETKELNLVGDESYLDYEVTNDSSQYDASVKINCTATSPEILDYVDIDYSIDKEIITAKSRANGRVKVTLKKSYSGNETFSHNFTCNIKVDALSKENINDTILEVHEYYAYGYLLKNDEPLVNKVVAIVDEKNNKFTTTDARGMYIFENLTGGDYNFLVFENSTTEELVSKTKEELLELATEVKNFNTGDGIIALSNYDNKYSKINPGVPTKHTITFDTTEGTTQDFTSTVIEGEQIGYLPIAIEHETLAFEDWKDEDIIVSEEDIANGDIFLSASYGTGVAKIGEKGFRTLAQAFDYIDTTNETTINVIENNALKRNITNDKNVILNLNNLKVNLDKYSITNAGNLTIKNGSIDATGLDIITNNGILYLNDNLNINYLNNTNENEIINGIVNNNEAIISNTTIDASSSNYVENQSIINNNGTMEITSSSITSSNLLILDQKDKNMNINNTTLIYKNDKTIKHILQTYGNLVLEDNDFRMAEGNELSQGIIQPLEGSNVSLKSGSIDNTYGKANAIYATGADSILNIGEKDKEIILKGVAGYPSIASYGQMNILDGTINSSLGSAILAINELTVGSSTSTPIIDENGGIAIIVREGSKNKIINANINANNGESLRVEKNAKLTIDNINLTSYSTTNTYSQVIVSGELVINDGTFTLSSENTQGKGVLHNNSTGIVTINGGTFDGTNAKSNNIYNYGVLNTGNKNNIHIIGNGANSYIIYNNASGKLNIIDGNITFDAGFAIGSAGLLTVGSETTKPIITGASSKNVFEVRSNKENKIINADITAKNSNAINVYESMKLEIEDATITMGEATGTSYLVYTAGTLTIKSGIYKKTVGKSGPIFGSAKSTLNIGENNKNIDVYCVDGYYGITSRGVLNIPAGTVTSKAGFLIGYFGTGTIGTETTTPTIIGNKNEPAIQLREEGKATIINANVKSFDTFIISVDNKANLTIDNINLEQINTTSIARAINVDGTLNINNGEFTSMIENNASYGLFNVREGSTLNIDGGTFNYNGPSNLLYLTAGVVNIGENEKNPILIQNTNPGSNPLISNRNATLNIYSGNIITKGSSAIRQNLENEDATDEEKLNHTAVINIYGGRLEATSDSIATISIEAGKFNMSGGEVINNGAGRTIYNNGGTAIQTGGISANNYGVTAQ